jgi:hypothetical protein
VSETEKSVEHKLPDAVIKRLHIEYLRAVGASQAAEAARQVAQEGFNTYQTQLGSCLEMLGVDPKERWYVDFERGIVTNQLPEGTQQQPANGAMVARTAGP